MLSSVLSLLHSCSIVPLVFSHTRATDSASILVIANVILRQRMISEAVSSSCMSSALTIWSIAPSLIERSSYCLQIKEIDTEFDSTEMVDLQTSWDLPSMKQLPTKPVCKLNFAIFYSYAAICRIAFLVLKYRTCPHPMLVSNFCVVPKSLFRCSSEVSLVGHKVIIHRPFTPVNGGV